MLFRSAEAETVVREGAVAREGAGKLRTKYDLAAARLEERSRLSNSARQKAQKILKEASTLSIVTGDKLKELTDMADVYSSNEKQLSDLTKRIDDLNDRMNEYLGDIKRQAEYYSSCTS